MPTDPPASSAADWAVLPNLGAEEGAAWADLATHPGVRHTAALWRLLFPASHRVVGPASTLPLAWPPALGEPATTAAFGWLDAQPGLHPWLADKGARALANDDAAAFAGPDPDATRRVHDKAFAVTAASELGYEPGVLRGTSLVLDPDGLRDEDSAIAAIVAGMARWPDWIAGYTLKPRLGGSGRGRVGGRCDAPNREAIRRGLPRLAARGGAVLEPWLERTLDLSVGLHLDPEPAADAPDVRLLGSLEQIVTPSGVPLGHVGEIDSRGRVTSGAREDEDTREAAVAVAHRARADGYFGPCGVDAFTFRVPDPEEGTRSVLRPVVELNARYTLGIVAIGVMRRLLPTLRREHGLSPGERLAFLIALRPPGGHATWTDAETACVGETTAYALDARGGSDAPGPGVLVAAARTAFESLRESGAEDR